MKWFSLRPACVSEESFKSVLATQRKARTRQVQLVATSFATTCESVWPGLDFNPICVVFVKSVRLSCQVGTVG